jgi:16S rRNA processing protein RimM
VIPQAERAPLEEGAVYIGDLLGCTLFDRSSGQTAGEIIDVDRESANMELLVVRPAGPAHGVILIPFANAYEPDIDLEARRMEMTLPAGLLELDAPLTPEEREALAAEQSSDSLPLASGSRSKKRK